MAPNSAAGKPVNPNEHLNIPKWINAEYFEPIMKRNFSDYKKIVNFSTIAVTPPGENYTSTMVRVVMDIEKKDSSIEKVSYILKTELQSKESAALVSQMNLFPKEKLMYKEILPAFEKLYKNVGVSKKFGPKCLHTEETPERITLVMEDLQRRHFVNENRLKGFDMAHMRVTLEKLAEFHAASAKYHELHGAYDDMFQGSIYNEKNRAIFKVISESKRAMMPKVIREWGLENAEHYIAKLPSFEESFEAGKRMNIIDPDEFNVLNHGDSWANNLMFNHTASGEVNEMIFVDFQLAKWGTPAQDLWYMIVSSASLDIKVKEFDHFIHIYHQRLAESLKLLKYSKKIPTLKELHILMIKYSNWGISTSNSVLTVVLLPSDKDSNLENMLKTDKHHEDMKYQKLINPYYAKAMCQLYPFFDNKGMLDYAAELK